MHRSCHTFISHLISLFLIYLEFTDIYRDLYIYNILVQGPAHIQYTCLGTCTYTIYLFRDLYIYNIFVQGPVHVQYTCLGTCTYTINKCQNDICQLRLDFVTLVQGVSTNPQVVFLHIFIIIKGTVNLMANIISFVFICRVAQPVPFNSFRLITSFICRNICKQKVT